MNKQKNPPHQARSISASYLMRGIISLYSLFNADRHAGFEPELQVVIMETIFLLLTRTTAPSRELTSFITLYRLFFV
jgi:hypothetical protein